MKKQWAVMMATVLISGMVAGCGGKQEAPAESTTAKAETTAAETESTKAEEETTKVETEEAAGEQTELIVFAAASMTETLTESADMYEEINPNVKIVYTFDSSGTLKTQIQEGADCDIFISAAQKQMNQLDSTADPSVNTEGLDFVLQGTRFNLVENKVVLAVPNDNPADIQNYEDLGTDKLSLICTEILTNLGIMEKLESESKITYGSNVKEVTTQVKEASVDCGIIYATDAFSAELTVVDEAEEGQCAQVIYPAAVLNISQNQEEAQTFLDFLTTDECAKVFESVGFSMAQ